MGDLSWDVFISHASEDKDEIARPLAKALKRGGARVWIDEHELKLGDSLTGKIDQGLASSRFGVVILSPNFFAKRWPKNELAGLRALEENGRKVILPVWHDVDKTFIAEKSPVVADLLAVHTSKGLDAVARDILEVIFSPDSGSPSLTRPTVGRILMNLLQSKPGREEFLSFIQSHPRGIGRALRSSTNPLWREEIAGVSFDAVLLGHAYPISAPMVQFVSFLPLWESPFSEEGDASKPITPSPLLKEAIDRANHVISKYNDGQTFDDTRGLVRRDVPIEFRSIIKRLYEMDDDYRSWPVVDYICPVIEVAIFAGRRAHVQASEASSNAWDSHRRVKHHCRLRTYDGLIEAVQFEEDW